MYLSTDLTLTDLKALADRHLSSGESMLCFDLVERRCTDPRDALYGAPYGSPAHLRAQASMLREFLSNAAAR